MELMVLQQLADAPVEVPLFGRSFKASIAPAELARASGCALLGVSILNSPQGYRVELLPEFTYDRRELNSRRARIQLTRRIMEAFEPVIRRNPEQWYHFVPIWPEHPTEKGSTAA
ncbi:MAG: hypothetical protein K9N48_07325 [Verrucomicrobia bacterium]|nr:hypothetical protein [Verrucomicrobiota bacterium]MCF7708617.1 hypothetical protein [Verrucomicrobiota bacterium]